MQTETVPQLWPLQSGSTNNPTLTPGSQTTFQFQDVPDRSPTGPLAYYLPGCLLTFKGNIVQSGGTGNAIYSDMFFAMLFSNLSWIQAWMGSAIQSQHVQGSQWQVIEYFANGYRYAENPRGAIAPAAPGTYPFEVVIFVPFASDRTFNLEAETSQLALLARASQLQINVAPTSVLTTASPGASITSFTGRCSAVLNPRAEIVLGTPIETILTQIVAGAGNSVKITNFGTDTGLQGIDPGGGVMSLLFLTNQLLQGGSFDSANITDFTWQWRGQSYTQDILALLSTWKRNIPAPFFGGTVGNQGSGITGNSQLIGVPYIVDQTQLYPQGGFNTDLRNLLFWALVLNGQRPRLTSLQTADSDQTFNMTVTGGYSGTHQILGRYARSWQPQMVKQWIGQVMAGGQGSLARYVLGANYANASLGRRGAQGKLYTTNDESRYLPYQLFPVAG